MDTKKASSTFQHVGKLFLKAVFCDVKYIAFVNVSSLEYDSLLLLLGVVLILNWENTTP